MNFLFLLPQKKIGMSVITYENLPTTTLTSVTLLDGEIDIDHLYYLLPVTFLYLDKNCYDKIPTCNIKGAILSIRYKGMNRGFPKDTCFKNSVMIDLSMGNKNVSIKLSQKKIQLCGASSEKMSREASQIMVAYIKRIQELLNLLQKNKAETKRTIQWLTENTKFHHEKSKTYITRPPENYHLVHYDYPKGVNKTIAQWLIPFITDYVKHEEYVMFLDYVQKISSIIVSPSIDIQPMEVKMKNHNYLIPFVINRKKLFNFFRKLDDWIVIYDASWDTYVKILRLSEEKKSKMKNEEEEFSDKYHTFLVFSTGSVTQSGPNPAEIETFYNEFNTLIREHRDQLEMKTNRIMNRKIRIPKFTEITVKPAPPYENILEQIN